MVFVFWHDRRLSEIYSNRRPDNCTFFFSGCNLIDEGRNLPKNIAHNFFQNMRYGDTREHRIVLEAAQNTKHNTHRHNNQQDELCHPPSSSFAPSLSMGRAVAPPNHGPAAPQSHAQAASHWGCACCRWFASLGRQNKRHRIIERGGVPWP